LRETHSERADDLPVIIHWLQLSGDWKINWSRATGSSWQSAGIKLWATSTVVVNLYY